jgi:hypothetical protein
MHQEIVEAISSNSFTGRVSGQVFRTLAPVLNPAFFVDEVHSVEQAIE